MNIYIPNIKPPKDEPGAFQVIVMYVGADGKLRAECGGTHEITVIPPHGDLIDRDGIKWIEEEFEERCHNDRWTVVEKIAYKAQVDKLPTIIPAEEGE